MKITEHEMRGLLSGKCLPGDMRVNEDLSSYLVRKFSELQQKVDKLEKEYKDVINQHMPRTSEGCDEGWSRVIEAQELQQKLDAMAAENAALKQIAMEYANLADSRLSEMTANCESDCSMECYDFTSKLPATDAYLNSVRAEGVDMVAEAIGNSAAKLKVGSKDWKSLKSIVFTLVNFAAQLRSGTHDTADKAG